jgi:hypothetical protein
VLKALPPITLPLWLVMHREVRSSRRVRVVADFLVGALGGQQSDPGTLRWNGREVERTDGTQPTSP